MGNVHRICNDMTFFPLRHINVPIIFKVKFNINFYRNMIVIHNKRIININKATFIFDVLQTPITFLLF